MGHQQGGRLMATLSAVGVPSPGNAATLTFLGEPRSDASGFPVWGTHPQPGRYGIPGVAAPGLVGGGTGIGGAVIPTVGQVWPRTS